MIYRKLSKRQLLAMTWWNRPKLSSYDALICDGSVRSGKTLAMSVGFLLWSMQTFNGQTCVQQPHFSSEGRRKHDRSLRVNSKNGRRICHVYKGRNTTHYSRKQL